MGDTAEERMEEGRAADGDSGSEVDTSPPDSPSEAEEVVEVEPARTPREPKGAKGKPPGSFHKGKRA